jgi:hypothetical protein
VRRLDAALEPRHSDDRAEKGGVEPPHSKALRAGILHHSKRQRRDSANRVYTDGNEIKLEITPRGDA